MERINCPVCGESNPAELKICHYCKQLLRQSTSQLNGAGKLIDSGQSPTAKTTSELEHALPAWLKNARQGENIGNDAEQAEPEEVTPVPPPPLQEESEPEPIKDEEASPLDWLAGLDDSDDEEDEEAADWLVNLQSDLAPEEAEVPAGIPATDEPITAGDAPRPSNEEEIPVEEDELPSWISDLQGESTSQDAEALPNLFEEESPQEFVADTGDAESGDLPDWLSTLSKESDSASPSIETSPVQPASISQAASESPSIDAEEALPDWMGDLQSAAEIPAEEVQAEEVLSFDAVEEDAPAVAGDDLPDWMAGLQGDSVVETASEESAPAMASGEDLPDWLSGGEGVSDAPVAEETQAEEVLSFDAVEEDAPAVAGDDLPDWMADLQGDSVAATASEESAPAMASGEDLPDWLSGGEGVSDAPVVEETQAEEVLSFDTAEEDVPAVAGDDLPDWMADLQGDSVAATASEESAPAMASGEDLPDWLSGGEATSDAPVVEETQVEEVLSFDAVEEDAPAVAGDDLPDWMSGLQGDSVAEIPAEESAPAMASGEDLPDWLSGGEGVTDVPVAEEAQAEEVPSFESVEEDVPILESADLPDWMASLSPDTIEDTPSALSEDDAFATDLFGTEASPQESDPVADMAVDVDETDIPLAEEADVPDWLSKMEKPITGALDASTVEEAPAFVSDGESPEWLDNLPGIDAGDKEIPETALLSDDMSSGAEEDIFGIETPDWLSNLGPDDVDDELGIESETDEVEADASADGAELPSWVQAMRPVAGVISDSDDDAQAIVKTGPLAGLSGVLPTGTGLGQINKPRAHSLRLSVTDSQKDSATLLEELLAGETEASSFEMQEKASSKPIVRWIIAVLLFLVVGSSLLSKSRMVSSPNMIVPEIRDTITTIEELPEGGSALLIFDYEAGFSGEMKTVAAPLVSQLMSRGEMLTILSTTPMGATLAENFLAETQEDYEFVSGINYLNLGYLPGSSAGILSFISNPQGAIIAELDDTSIWDLPPLENVQNFADFSVVIVLTDDVEKGRSWIEQSTAFFGRETNSLSMPSFLMAVSAQAEPIIYPYYASGQIDGLVSGLSGGATYERLQNQEDGLGRKYWDAYSVGLLLAEILISIGAMINFLAALRSKQKTKKEEN